MVWWSIPGHISWSSLPGTTAMSRCLIRQWSCLRPSTSGSAAAGLSSAWGGHDGSSLLPLLLPQQLSRSKASCAAFSWGPSTASRSFSTSTSREHASNLNSTCLVPSPGRAGVRQPSQKYVHLVPFYTSQMDGSVLFLVYSSYPSISPSHPNKDG